MHMREGVQSDARVSLLTRGRMTSQILHDEGVLHERLYKDV